VSAGASCGRPIRVLHAFATFDVGGPQRRAVQLAAAWGSRAEHTVVATDGRYAAAEIWPENISLQVQQPPRGKIWTRLGAMRALLRSHDPDLVLTYNWGAIEWLLAARSVGRSRNLVHHEDGFGVEEQARRLWRRSFLRRRLLPRVGAVVVPSGVLAAIARDEWRVPTERLHHLPNGVDLARFAASPDAERERGERSGPVVFGVVGGLRPVKDQALAIRALARTDAGKTGVRLRLVGDGPDRSALESLASELGVRDRVEFAGHVGDPASEYRGFDVLAISSRSEQMPLALLEAMASGLPVVSTDVGDVRAVLGPDNRGDDLVVPPGDADALAAAMTRLAADPARRVALGRANREHVERHYERSVCDARFLAVYEAAARCGAG
jgi:glycosyltransferase involved in cell wall biosynthesis